jgi:hypothetical protein
MKYDVFLKKYVVKRQVSLKYDTTNVRVLYMKTCAHVVNKGKAVPLQAWSGPEGSFIVKVKQSRYRPGVAQRVPL